MESSEEIIKLVLAEPSMQIIEELQKAAPFGKRIEFYLASHTMIDECFLKMAEPISA